MRWWLGLPMTVAVVTLSAAPQGVEAQRGPRRMAEGPPGAAFGVERILSQRERLELSDEQVAQLDALRREAVTSRQAGLDELADLRSRMRAGEPVDSQFRAAMAARREAQEARREAHQNRIEAILTDEQRTTLSSLRREGRASRGWRHGGRSWRDGPRGRAWGPRDRGFRRGPRGFLRGPRRRPI